MRLPDWENRLAEYVGEHARASFRFGQLDCALFAAGAVLAMTGEDPAAEFRGRYKSAASAARALKKYGAGDLISTIAGKFEEKPIGFAQRGDLVMHDGAVGVCMGAYGMFVGAEGGEDGLVRVPRADWTKAFTV